MPLDRPGGTREAARLLTRSNAHSGDESDANLRHIAGAFARPDRRASLLQLLTSFGPVLAGCTAMYLVLPFSCLGTLALAVPTGALLVRVFIVQHDCGHGSCFAGRRTNAAVGWACSLLTMTPYAHWARQHSQHHASWNNLDRAGDSDIYSNCLTVRAYLGLSPWRRFLYRLPRHPLLANLVLPPLIFLLLYRIPFDTPRAWRAERRSVHLTNAALAGLFGTLVVLLGWRPVLLVHLPLMVVASILGVWLFSVQHRFDTARWTVRGDWSFVDAALDGSSWLALPAAAHWLTGNIGFHHVHHLNPRVPSYRLGQAHDAVRRARAVPPLTVRRGLAAMFLTLWDERSGRLVRFRDVAAP
jgi:omega-6 fatty acid desaturase (delta-12 desaturase)